jgi:AcrR family transcriptional regulator
VTAQNRPLRADAQRNRARVLDAAEAVLAREGLSASMRTIASEAGVGLGTIYRHFPTQEALYQAILAERTHRLIAQADAFASAEDPGAAFFAYFTLVVTDATHKKSLADVLAASGIDPKGGLPEDIGRTMRNAIEKLLVRARRAGAVRQDLHMPEAMALLTAACLAAERSQWDTRLRNRTLAILFDGLRPRH